MQNTPGGVVRGYHESLKDQTVLAYRYMQAKAKIAMK
jgi:hypothetical protein